MKKRTISAVFLMLLLIGSFIINSKLFCVLMLMLSLIGFKEFFDIKYKDNNKKIRLIKYLGMFSLGLIIINNFLWKIDILVFILLTLLILALPIVINSKIDKYNINDYFYVVGIVFLLGLGFGNICDLAVMKKELCIFIFLMAFMTDTYAYIGGSLIGRHKFSVISQNKTIEGILCGSIMGTIIGVTYYYNIVGNLTIIETVILCLGLTILSEIGDLIFSSIKRVFEKKDFSNLIPGHGGVLDRFDSVLFVSLGLMLLLRII